jgi:hypothetical protein
MPATSGTMRVIMERTPKRCPVPVRFHANHRPEDLFGGGEDIDVHVACDLLSSQGYLKLDAQRMGDGNQDLANQGTRLCWLAPQENVAGSASGGDGDQDE